MGFSLFGKHTEEKEISVILDIGSASVGAALVSFEREQLPKILYSTRIPITIPEEVNEKDFTISMLGFVKKALEQIVSVGIKHNNFKDLNKRDIKRVFCIYASPWFASETKNIHIKRDEPIVLSETYVEDLIKKEQQGFKKKLGIKGEVSIVEQKIISTKLNGYLTHSPYYKKAHNIELNTFLGIVPSSITADVENSINLVLNPKDIVHHSFSLVAYRTITNLFPTDSNSIIFDITGEVTDISIVDNDVITKTASVPFGRNSLVRKIAKEKNSNNDIALSLLHLYAKENMEPNLRKQTESIISGTLISWKDEIQKIIPDIKEKTVFITADTDISEVFQKYVSLISPQKMIILNEDHFAEVVRTEKGVREDLFISTSVLFLDNLFQSES